jgi:DNA-binding beta-propeller fold protein YncE
VNQIAGLDTVTGAILKTFNVGLNPSEVMASADGKLLFVSIRNENKLQVLDSDTGAILHDIFVGVQPDTLQLTPDQKSMIVALRGSPAQVAVVDLGDYSVNWVNLAGTTTGHNAISANGRYSFVALEGSTPGVSVIDHKTGDASLIYPFPSGGRPHGIWYEPSRLIR